MLIKHSSHSKAYNISINFGQNF